MTEFPDNEAAAALFGVHVGGLGMDRVGAVTGPLLDEGPLVAAPFIANCAEEAHDVGFGTDKVAGRADGTLVADVTSGFTAAGTDSLAPGRGLFAWGLEYGFRMIVDVAVVSHSQEAAIAESSLPPRTSNGRFEFQFFPAEIFSASNNGYMI